MKKPKIRFTGFNGDWERIQLSDILSISNEQNKKNTFSKEDVFSVSDEFGVVNQIKHLGRSYAGKSLTGYKVLRENQIVYTKSPLRAKPYGIIKVNELGTGIVSVLYGIYNVNEGTYPKYIERYFEPGYRTNNYLLPLINKGAKNTINISDQSTLNGSIYLPIDIKEQKAICNYLETLDSLIQSTTKKIESLKQVKAASLQSMFPQDGETTPRVRFKGFEGEWEKVSLGSLFSERSEYDINAEMLSVTQNKGIIKAADNGRFDNSNNDKSKYKLVKVNDIAYNSMRMWQGACGCSTLEGIVSPAYTVISPIGNLCSKFFYYMFKTNKMLKVFRLASQGLTSDTWNLKFPAFGKLKITYPYSIDEQIQIAAYFNSLDHQITLQTQRLEKLKQIKAACLDNMFV